jgi:hypothetical protein
MVGLGTRSTIERVEIGNSRPKVARASALPDSCDTTLLAKLAMVASGDESPRIPHRGCSVGVVLSGTRGEPGLQCLPNVVRRRLYALPTPMGIEGIV